MCVCVSMMICVCVCLQGDGELAVSEAAGGGQKETAESTASTERNKK